MALQANDFLSANLEGHVTVDGGTVTITDTIQPIEFEGDKSFRIKLRKASPANPVIATTAIITIKDYAEIINVASNVVGINENQSVQFTITAANITTNHTLFYNTVGNVNIDDFVESNIGSFVLYASNNTGIVTLLANADLSGTSEIGEQFSLQIRKNSNTGAVVGTSANVIVISDTSYVTSLASIETTANLFEGEQVNVIVQTLNARNEGPNLYYTAIGNANIYGVWTGNYQAEGIIPLNSNNYAEITLLAETNVPVGEDRQLQFEIRRDSNSGTILATSDPIIVKNASNIQGDPIALLIDSCTANVNPITANNKIRFDVSGRGGNTTETLYVTTVYSGDESPILTDGTTSFVLQSGTGSFEIQTNNWISSAETKEIFVEIRRDFYYQTGNNSGRIIFTSSNVTIEKPIQPLTATGGTIILDTANNYVYQTFISTDNFVITSTSPSAPANNVDYLVVAGGGGGAGKRGGGGGAGGLLTGSFTATPSTSLLVTVGAGGSTATGEGAAGTPGRSSNLTGSLTVIALGGGRGGAQGPSQVVPWPALPGNPGGSGGGGGRNDGAPPATTGLNGAGTPGQGNPGGTNPSPNAGSGGGGFGSAGQPSNSPNASGGAGGTGTETYNPWFKHPSISALPGVCGGGGGGGPGTHPTGGKPPGVHGGGDGGKDTNNTAPTSLATAGIQYSGGGGGGGPNSTFISGGAGGSGLVIFRYPLPTEKK